MKKFLPLFFLLWISLTAFAAKDTPIWHTGTEGPVYHYDIAAGSPRLYYDKGGPDKDIDPNFALTIVQLRPATPDAHITVVFEEMEIGKNDEMRFYNGAITLWNGPDESGEYYYDWPRNTNPIYTVKGTPEKQAFSVSSTAADGCLTVGFTHLEKAKGWKATVYCVKNGSSEPTVSPRIFYVTANGTGNGSSWQEATNDLQEAIDAAQAGDEIWVAQGVYKAKKLISPSKKRSYAFILKEGVSIYGGFAGTEKSREERERQEGIGNQYIHETILSADDEIPDVWKREKGAGSNVREEWTIEGNKDNANHILYSKEHFEKETVFEGLTLKGSNANVYNVYCGGGALYASGHIELLNCTLAEHYAYTSIESMDTWKYYGGAVTLLKGQGKATISNCMFTKCMVSMPNGTAAGAGVYIEEGKIENAIFEDCIALDQGGAIYAIRSLVKKCVLGNNYASSGGAIYAKYCKLENNTLYSNKAMRGGGIFAIDSHLSNNIIYNCYADDPIYKDGTFSNRGGGAIWGEGKSDLVGNLIYNCSGYKGGGVFLKDSGDFVYNTIVNCISVFEPETSNLVSLPTSVIPLNSVYTAVDEATTFASPSSFKGYTNDKEKKATLESCDWHLLQTSSLIATGKTSNYDNTKDIYDKPRIINNKINPGAIAQAISRGDNTPNITLTFAPVDRNVRIGTGGSNGTKFAIDYGDGELHKFEGAKNISFTPSGKVKIYGDKLLLFICEDEALTSIDFGVNPELFRIMIYNSQITKIDLTKLPALKGLYLKNNALEGKLDLSGLTKINVVEVPGNRLSEILDLSSLSQLTKVDCSDNKLSALLLPSTDKLKQIDCSTNNIATLDLRALPSLVELSCEENKLSALDLSMNTALEKLYCPNNQITSLDVSKNKSLRTITAFNNKIAHIDLSNNVLTEGLYLQENELLALDLSRNSALRWVNIGHNHLNTIDLSNLTSLMLLNIEENELTAIDLSNNPAINTLHIGKNKIASVDLAKQKGLYWLTCGHNQLTSLDVSANENLSWLECQHNQLVKLDLKAQKNLQKLIADHNKLTDIDLKGKKGIQGIYLHDNLLPAQVLKKLIEDIPDVSAVEIHDNNKDWAKHLIIRSNIDNELVDTQSAEAKGWIVDNALSSHIVPASSPSPFYDSYSMHLICSKASQKIVIYSTDGETIVAINSPSEVNDLSTLAKGNYIASIIYFDGSRETIRFVK